MSRAKNTVNYALLTIILFAIIFSPSAFSGEDVPENNIVEDDFFSTAEITNDVSSQWIFKDLLLSIIKNAIEIKTFSEDGNHTPLWSKEQIQSAMIRVGFKNPPEYIVSIGKDIPDKDALGFIKIFSTASYGLSYNIEKTEFFSGSNTDEIDVGGVTIFIPRIVGYKINDNKKTKSSFIEYIESDPPIRSMNTTPPMHIVLPYDDFGEGAAYEVNSTDLMNNMIEKRKNRNINGKIMIRMNGSEYSTILIYGGNTGKEKNAFAICSIMIIKNRVIMIGTEFPWRALEDYHAGTKQHQAWRDAIVSTNNIESSPHAAEWRGECVSVTDGDTIRVMHDGKEERIRFYGIDAPERGQDFSARSREFVADMTFRKIVTITPMDTDRYGRTVALVDVDGESVNREIIAAGLAWVYPQYCTQDFCEDWREVETDAREAKRGLWAHPDPVPPWEWRRKQRR